MVSCQPEVRRSASASVRYTVGALLTRTPMCATRDLQSTDTVQPQGWRVLPTHMLRVSHWRCGRRRRCLQLSCDPIEAPLPRAAAGQSPVTCTRGHPPGVRSGPGACPAPTIELYLVSRVSEQFRTFTSRGSLTLAGTWTRLGRCMQMTPRD